jgi:hypothetical protein
VEKYGRSRQTTDDNTIWRMRFTCWITRASDTHSGFVLIIYFPWKHWLRERASVLHYTYTYIDSLQFIRPNIYAPKCERSLLHVSALLECHHQGVLISIKFVPLELVRDVKRSHSLTHALTQSLTNTGNQ